MFSRLDDTARRTLYRCSAILCASSLMLLPLSALSSIEPAGSSSRTVPFRLPSLERASPQRAIAVVRDPFVPAVSDSDGAASTAGTEIVRGLLLGERPQAVLEEGGHDRLVGIGSEVAGVAVVAITQSGVVLENGTVLHLANGGPQ